MMTSATRKTLSCGVSSKQRRRTKSESAAMSLQTSVVDGNVLQIQGNPHYNKSSVITVKKTTTKSDGMVYVGITNETHNLSVVLTSDEWREILEFIAPADIAAILHITPEQVTE